MPVRLSWASVMGKLGDETESEDEVASQEHAASRPAGLAGSPRGIEKFCEGGDGASPRRGRLASAQDPSSSRTFAEVWRAHRPRSLFPAVAGLARSGARWVGRWRMLAGAGHVLPRSAGAAGGASRSAQDGQRICSPAHKRDVLRLLHSGDEIFQCFSGTVLCLSVQMYI